MPAIHHGDRYYFNSYQPNQNKRPRHFSPLIPGRAGA